MAHFFWEGNAQVSYAVDGGHDLGFTPRGYRVQVLSGGPIEWSFDGASDAGRIGPSGTRPMDSGILGGGSSKVWFKGSGEVVEFWAWA
jgi:hypothetical protein